MAVGTVKYRVSVYGCVTGHALLLQQLYMHAHEKKITVSGSTTGKMAPLHEKAKQTRNTATPVFSIRWGVSRSTSNTHNRSTK